MNTIPFPASSLLTRPSLPSTLFRTQNGLSGFSKPQPPQGYLPRWCWLPCMSWVCSYILMGRPELFGVSQTRRRGGYRGLTESFDLNPSWETLQTDLPQTGMAGFRQRESFCNKCLPCRTSSVRELFELDFQNFNLRVHIRLTEQCPGKLHYFLLHTRGCSID